MTSRCLQLTTLIMQQVNEAQRLPRTPPAAAAPAPSGRLAGAAASIPEGAAAAETIKVMLPLTLRQLGPAVYHAVKHTADLKQRQQLLRLWADVVAAMLQEAGEQSWQQ
jgi:hypothetical protein